MAKQPTELEVLIKTTGTEKLRGLTSSLKRLKDTTTITATSTGKLTDFIKRNSQQQQKSINGTAALANSYRQLAQNVDFTSKEFKEATAEAARLEGQLRKMQAAANKGMGKGRIGAVAKTAGAIGAAGIYGGAEGAVGSAIGAIVGGLPGAITGGVVGAQVGQVTGAVAEIAKYDAALEKQRKALKLVIKDTDQYNKAQEFLAKTSKELAIPQDVIVRQFTSLTASVKGAGLSVDDAQESFLAIASGIRGTGGTLEDMKSAMRATSQVFSKGKVSAEELRQQLGERLPGAFTLFAESMNKTPAELDKALEQGKVTLDDFLGFSEKLFSEYGENAKILAQAPESAGDRLQTAVSNLKDNVGDLLKPIGANFQTTFAEIVDSVNEATKSVINFFEIGDKFKITNIEKQLTKLITLRNNLEKDIKTDKATLQQKQESGDTGFFSGFNKLAADINKSEAELIKFNKQIDEAKEKLKSMLKPIKDVDDATKDLGETNKSVFKDIKTGMQSYLDSIKDVNKQIEDATVNAFKKMEDALVNFVMTGKLNFNDFARSLIADITRIYVRQSLITPLLGAFGLSPTTDSKNAKGNIYNKDGLIKFAKGAIITEPTYFRYGGAGKLGLMGEAGAEAIMPLKRTSSGNLGVEATGGGSTNVVVNVDASGSSVEGDDQSANQLGQVIAAAVQAEIVNQKMSGGLLS